MLTFEFAHLAEDSPDFGRAGSLLAECVKVVNCQWLERDDGCMDWSLEMTLRRVPLQYLTNSAHWGNLVIAAGCGVLIPRPETYCLIELAQEVCNCVSPLHARLVELRKLCYLFESTFAASYSMKLRQCVRNHAMSLPSGWSICPFFTEHVRHTIDFICFIKWVRQRKSMPKITGVSWKVWSRWRNLGRFGYWQRCFGNWLGWSTSQYPTGQSALYFI